MKYITEPIKNVYRLEGNDDFVINEVLTEIKSACGGEFTELNQTVFNDENFSADKIIEASSQIPFLAEKRLVLVKDITKLNKEDEKKLIVYCKNASPYSVLVFVDTNKIFASVPCEQISCKPLSSYQISNNIKIYLSEKSKEIETDALSLLIENCSGSMAKVYVELEKLLAYLGERKKIVFEDVDALVAKSDDYNIYELSEALSKRDKDKSVRLLSLMLKDGDAGFILSLLANHFRRLFHAKISSESNAEIAKYLGVKEYAIVKAKAQCKNFGANALRKIIDLILETDYMIKSGQMNSVNAIHYLVFSILENK